MESRRKAQTLFDMLDLTKKFPQKITTLEALCIQPNIPGQQLCRDPKELYLHVLQMIMAYHKRCRANLLQSSDSDDNSIAADSFDDIFSDEVQQSSAIFIHPMDVILALLHCSDDFLRQDLMARLVTCQLSIPLILPDPFTGELTYLLWAMRSIVKEWKCIKEGKEQIHEGQLVSFSIPMVAFVRFSKQDKSKSKLMNEVISDTHHDRFFHRDCEGGNLEWLLGGGLIEVSWYLPAAKSSDVFPDAVAFLNLHGDAREHEMQINFVSSMCLMKFVLINDRDLNEKCTLVLKSLSANAGGVVLLICSDRPNEFQTLKGVIPKEKLNGCMLKGKNADSIKKEIRSQINKKLKNEWNDMKHKQTLEDGKQVAQDLSIKVDESKPEFTKGQKMAHTLYDMIAENVVSAKKDMLPLQGDEMWQAWAKLDKEEHRPIRMDGLTIEKYSDGKYAAKIRVRELQLRKIKNQPSTLMDKFIMSLSQRDDMVQNYFLQNLKLLLNDLSRKSMSTLQSEYLVKRNTLLQQERDKDEEAAKKSREEVKQLQRRVVEASLGLEHLLRELTQIYEAAISCQTKSSIKEKYKNLPHLAAELFIKGYPLELMDGDAAHVPEKWIESVMKEVIQMLKDPKVFVMSVLGLQSTGKSTLMNTAFGLQFNVSAGRCTKGAYMQLLPICEELKKETNCDYVLVVDTEGLRAPELDPEETQKHDNELATFVIGLANVTMVNIYGEVPGDMDDILQTTVHAFLRMKSVKLNPSCQFVHQNVSAIAASKKGEVGRARFKDKLDLMTHAASNLEKECEGDYKCFSDVITFNSEQDVHHFPGLWSGVPPMAPVDEGYSNKAIALKCHLVDMLKHSRKQRLQAEKLSIIAAKTKRLWQALLNENFIFSFKNTLEIVVYNELDTQFIQWSRSLQSDMFKWREKKEGKIGTGCTAEELKTFQSEIDSELPGHISMQDL